MPRTARSTPGNLIYHVYNRGNAGLRIFRGTADYAVFIRALEEARREVPVRVLSYCLMPDHWHLLLWPRRDGELPEFVRWLSVTHTRRWHAQRHSEGSGHLYQGRYKSFPVEPGGPVLEVCRFIESNARRSHLVRKAQNWEWSSLLRRSREEAGDGDGARLLTPLPEPIPKDWLEKVNAPFAPKELAALRTSVVRGAPFGSAAWQAKIARKLHLEFTMRPRGRPRKNPPPTKIPDSPPGGKAEQAARPGLRARERIKARDYE